MISDFSARPKLALLERVGDARREKQPTETQIDVFWPGAGKPKWKFRTYYYVSVSEFLPDAIRAQTARILSSRGFAGAERMRRFLTLVVEHAIEGDKTPLKEYRIALDVFDKDDSFDPRADPIVRVEARRLRSKLKEYYAGEGTGDPIRIDLPQRGYCPVFRLFEGPREKEADVPGLPDRDPGTTGRTRWKRWVALAGVLAAAVTAVVYFSARPTGPADRGTSILVLPFTNMSSDPANEYFSDGLTVELINALTPVQGLWVVARASAFRYKGEAQDVRKIGRELNVRTVLEGNVRKDGDSIRITVELINVADGLQLWSQTYDRKMRGIFAVQDEIARAIVGALRSELGRSSGQPLIRRSTENLEAFTLYLQGRYYLYRFSQDAVRKSIECFQQAVVLDPKYALAHAGLAQAHIVLASFEDAPPRPELDKAGVAIERALQLDGYSSEARSAMADLKILRDWDWAGAEREYQEAIRLNPASPQPHGAYAVLCLSPLGRHDEAIAEMRRALALDPVSPMGHLFLSQIYLYARQYEKALQPIAQALEYTPGFENAIFQRAQVYQGWSKHRDAVSELEPVDSPLWLGLLGFSYGKLGMRRQARQALSRLQSQTANVRMVAIAGIYASLDENERALEWLERAYEARSLEMIYLGVDYRWDGLAASPRFRALRQKMRL